MLSSATLLRSLGIAYQVEEIPRSNSVPDPRAKTALSYGVSTLPNFALYEHQAAVADLVVAGKNVLLSSGTASGKTEAACLGILAKGGISIKEPCQVVVLYPTKALPNDQWERVRSYFANYHTCRFDADNPKRKSEVSHSEVVLTNPQMLIEHLKFSTPFAVFLNNLKFLVIDEVHLYSPFQWSLLLSYFNLIRKKGLNTQVTLLSATLGNPDHLCGVAQRWLGRPFIHVQGKTVSSGTRRYRVTHQVEDLSSFLEKIINAYSEDEGSTLIFLPYKSWVNYLYGRVSNKKVVRHHGSLGVEERREVEQNLRDGTAKVCLTCKTLQQGIDIGHISRVVHVGLPETVAEFWQREGRKGRLPDEGEAESILIPANSWDEGILRDSQRYNKLISMPIEATALPSRSMAATLFDGFYSALYHLPLESETLDIATKLGWLNSSVDFEAYMLGDEKALKVEPTLDGEKLFQSLSFYGFGRVPLLYEGSIIDETSYGEAVRAALPGCILQVDGSPYVVSGWSKYPVAPDPELRIYLKTPEDSPYAGMAEGVRKGMIFSRVHFDPQAVSVKRLRGAFSEVQLRPTGVDIYSATKMKPKKIGWRSVVPTPELPLYTNCFLYEAAGVAEEECEFALHALVHAMREEFSIPLNTYVHMVAINESMARLLLYESSWGDTHLLLSPERLLDRALTLVDMPAEQLLLPRCNQSFETKLNMTKVKDVLTGMVTLITNNNG